MKRIVLMLLCLVVAWPSMAQANYDPAQQELKFVYIAHDENTPVQTLVARLKAVEADATFYPDAVAAIFYLPNGDSPMVVRINTGVDDNPKDFPRLIDELQNKRAHDVMPQVDHEQIIRIFDDIELLNPNGTPRFMAVDWYYYVNSTFWLLNQNESVIASLYWIMDMEELTKNNYMRIHVFYGEETDKLVVNEELPFGEKKLNASMQFLPTPY